MGTKTTVMSVQEKGNTISKVYMSSSCNFPFLIVITLDKRIKVQPSPRQKTHGTDL